MVPSSPLDMSCVSLAKYKSLVQSRLRCSRAKSTCVSNSETESDRVCNPTPASIDSDGYAPILGHARTHDNALSKSKYKASMLEPKLRHTSETQAMRVHNAHIQRMCRAGPSCAQVHALCTHSCMGCACITCKHLLLRQMHTSFTCLQRSCVRASSLHIFSWWFCCPKNKCTSSTSTS